MTSQKKATVVSSSVAAVLTLLKLIIGFASGSVAVLASAVDSILDMFVSIFNYFAISKSEKPADKNFNYGRGKIEALASVIEGTIITLSGFFLLYQAIKKAIVGETSQYLDISIYVMIISLIITISLVTYLNFVAKKTNSMVIKADALHYKTDVFSNLAVLISLLLVTFTGYEIIDVFVGGGIAIYIIYSAYELIHEGILVLLDRAVDEEVVSKIEEIIKENNKVNTYHLLKTREAANQTFVEVHLVFDCLITLMDAHRASDSIENKIKKLDTSRDWIINIHMDPYDDFKINDLHH
ncbi:MAG: cation diffusion facilitator family transporter [Arcobacter sp.]|jgi:cation diffusion facilitator family transporter|uniref:Divalent metal cation transporter (ZT_dimer domain) n=1 Tax=Arcobacter defluvii TaxID=873191 RepID=A0AAE7E683_9BACT|nr:MULTISPECIES: cation diffusion facilitator family transporter [Arcobacter]MDY3199646.1 cation diffusion facilitator family transporter [Arcobacter sp.]QKF77122.1 divalent metal cation transporter (ZT_dimer domain) [Arcobacter defluvii]BAK73019.1 cation efflux protein [Arcobacter sp. L]